jgi:flagellar basal body-associated protein FliL
MKTRPLAAALLLALTPAASAAPAWAQSGAEDPTTSMARARFKEGVDFYDKAQYEQARAAFLQAYALKKHPAVLLNLAWSCLKSGHSLEAERYFKQFLSEGKEITEKQRADANDGLNQAKSKIGRIEVLAPAGTEITIDGDRLGSAPLPEPVAVEPGAHTLTFKGPETGTETQSVTVLGGEKAVARLGRSGAGAAPLATATPLPPSPAPTEAAPAPPPAPPQPEEPREGERHAKKEASHHEAGKKGPLDPPANIVPVILGGILAAAGAGVAIGMNGAKQSAQNNANATAQKVELARMQAPMGDQKFYTCPPAANSPVTGLAQVCSQYQNDINDVNTDATAGNIALAVGVAALAGTIIYWLVGDKGDDTSGSSAAAKPLLVPTVGRSVGGFSVSGTF